LVVAVVSLALEQFRTHTLEALVVVVVVTALLMA
jgi:hypothetical protein